MEFIVDSYFVDENIRKEFAVMKFLEELEKLFKEVLGTIFIFETF